MTALAAEFYAEGLDSKYIGGVTLPIFAAQIIYAGAIIAVVDGEWKNVTATTGLEGRYARARETVDNTLDGKRVEGIFLDRHGKWLTPLRNDTVAPITATDLGDEVFFVDNQTVSIDGTGRSKAGRVWCFATTGPFESTTDIVWVEVY